MDWPQKVNQRISIDGDYSQEDGFIDELRFDNGKSRTWQKNSYVPKNFPDLSLLLNNTEVIDDRGRTEKKIFEDWYTVNLRNGILPFYFPKLEKPSEGAVYMFIPESLSYDKTEGIVMASFGFREIAMIDGEIQSNLWITIEDQDASDRLPSSGKVGTVLQTIANFLKWVKNLFNPISGHKHNGIDSPRVSYNNLLDKENLENGIANIDQRLIQEITARIYGDENLQILVDAIIAKIPNQASSTNQLADKDFVNSSIGNMASNYVTPNAAGDEQWMSLEALNNGPWFYRGVSYTPTRNDYAVFLETDLSVYRSTYDGVQWNKSFKVNDRPFTAAELAALASGITDALVELIKSAIQVSTNLILEADTNLEEIGTSSITDNIIGHFQRFRRGINYLKNNIETGTLLFKNGNIIYNVSNTDEWNNIVTDINNNSALYQNAAVEILLSANITIDMSVIVPEGIKKLTLKSDTTTVRTITLLTGSAIEGHAGCDLSIEYIRIASATSLKVFKLTNFNRVYIREYISTTYLAFTLSDINRAELGNYISITSSGSIALANIPHVSCTLNGNIFRGVSLTADNCNFYLTGGASASLSNATAQTVRKCTVITNSGISAALTGQLNALAFLDFVYPVGSSYDQKPNDLSPSERNLPGNWSIWNRRAEIYELITETQYQALITSFGTAISSPTNWTTSSSIAANAWRVWCLDQTSSEGTRRLIRSNKAVTSQTAKQMNPIDWIDIQGHNSNYIIRRAARRHVQTTWTEADLAIGTQVPAGIQYTNDNGSLTTTTEAMRVVGILTMSGLYPSYTGGNRPTFISGGIANDAIRPMKGSFRPGSGDSRYTMGFDMENPHLIDGVFYRIMSQTDRMIVGQSANASYGTLGFDSGRVIESANENQNRTTAVQYWRRIS